MLILKQDSISKPFTEADITKQIRTLLWKFNIFHWKQWQGGMAPIKGISDILGIYKGQMIATEVKARSKLSQDQYDFIQKVNNNGGKAFVAYGPDDVARALQLNVDDNMMSAIRQIRAKTK